MASKFLYLIYRIEPISARAASETAGAQAARIDALAATVKAVEEKAAAAAGNPRIALAIAAGEAPPITPLPTNPLAAARWWIPGCEYD